MVTQENQWQVLFQSPSSAARLGALKTNHGVIKTPAFIPVGTKATIKSLTPEDLEVLRVQIFFANTYHLWLSPGDKAIKKLGGLHEFSHWHGPIITDSGGFQVFSLGRQSFRLRQNNNGAGKLLKINNQGAHFRSHIDGKKLFLTPEKSIEIQFNLGSDIILPLDDCSPYPLSRRQAELSLARTHLWSQRSLQRYQELKKMASQPPLIFGIIQGSYYQKLRQQSARFISRLPFAGLAIGGVSVGEPKEKMRQAVGWIMPLLPADKPRHLLGVGEIDDIFDFVRMGIDTFDCVLPTRLARMGKLMVKKKPWFIDITKSKFARDKKPIAPSCQCYACQNYTRAYLHHLFRERELLGYRLATYHNLYFYMELMRKIRQAIANNQLNELARQYGVSG